MSHLKNLLKQALAENQYELSDHMQQQLVHYLEMMQSWNRIINLTSITEPREMVYLHIIDSLSVMPYLHGNRLLDIGTGAGLPGIPLAITHPDQHWVLLDKNSKKTRFLTQVIAELKLAHVSAVHSRGEDFQPAYCFDSILGRAFGSIRLFAETTGHLLCPNGKLIAMKGKYPEEEINDIPKSFTIQDITRLELNGMNVERHIVRLIKEE